MTIPNAEEGVLAVVLAVAVALFAALLAWATVCAEQHACLKAGTCYALSNSSFSCAFKTSITPAGWRMLDFSSQSDSLQAMNRGVCAPGLRQSIDPFSGDLECVRKRSYPNALLAEIGDVDATSDHRRWCGDWIDAGDVATGQLKWAFFDEEDVEEDVEDVLLAKGSGRLGISDLGKFRTACRSMISSNSQGAAGKLEYDHLEAGIGTIGSYTDALRRVGYLSSYFCDGPAISGLAYTSIDGFLVNVSIGVELSGNALDEALYGVSAPAATRTAAKAYAKGMAEQPTASLPTITADVAHQVVLGSHLGTWVDGYATASYKVGYDVYNRPLAAFLQTYNNASVGGPHNARAYLQGVAAYCSYATRSVITGEFGSIGGQVRTQAETIARARPRAAALGRLKASPDERLAHVHGDELLSASGTTWSALSKSSIVGATRGHARATCLRAARVTFPDAFDHIIFETLVTERLYDRLETMSAEIKTVVHDTISDALIGDIFADSIGKSVALNNLQRTKLRIAGAPTGTWAGVTQTFSRPTLTSTDGALLIMLKQARAVYLDRLLKAMRSDSVCEHPPLYDALSRNAYLLVADTFSCAMILPGLLVPPIADERYDDPSIFSRVGYVIAHEFAHVTAFTNTWNQSYADELLKDYDPGTQVEAIADVAGVTAILRLGKVSRDDLCGHVSQMWCSRIGWLDGGGPPTGHPRGNVRGDYACQFLRRHL